MRILVPALLAASLLGGCNPTYNWREHTSQEGHYKILFPAKPATFTRAVDLDGLRVQMTMTAAEVDGATFAVGAAMAPDAVRARAALPAMRQALLRNIGADDDAAPAPQDGLRVEATGAANGKPMHLHGRFETRGERFYQVIVLGPANAAPPEQVDQFLSSFAPQ
ncbi:hypothetical protein [Massilia sp. CFBP9026]|uniref:hypothetical protein n=1 Tax=Massilia sp. CFBP9026 TaxID=3096536 RepID=UPI002A69FAA8|nr:hypothetical protein [Massilia sp. CFBP9026]MDY0965483.1 hypothetical protein [Massilia sp. CFBP9026]